MFVLNILCVIFSLRNVSRCFVVSLHIVAYSVSSWPSLIDYIEDHNTQSKDVNVQNDAINEKMRMK